jgi:predicted site-specific integrase-resolvase
MLEMFCSSHGWSFEIISDLGAADVLEIITVFTARLYGSRSRKNKKLIADLEKAVSNEK